MADNRNFSMKDFSVTLNCSTGERKTCHKVKRLGKKSCRKFTKKETFEKKVFLNCAEKEKNECEKSELNSTQSMCQTGSRYNSLKTVKTPVTTEVIIRVKETPEKINQDAALLGEGCLSVLRHSLAQLSLQDYQLANKLLDEIFINKQPVNYTAGSRIYHVLPVRRVCHDDVSRHVTCCICLNVHAQEDRVVTLRCDHLHHLACIAPWFAKNDTCPMCRDKI